MGYMGAWLGASRCVETLKRKFSEPPTDYGYGCVYGRVLSSLLLSQSWRSTM